MFKSISTVLALATEEDCCHFGISAKWGGKWKCGYIAFNIRFINIVFILGLNRCVCEVEE